MIDYDLLESTQKPTVTIVSAPVVETSVATIPLPSARSTDVGVASADWTWEMLRDYVVRNIESFHGPFPRDFRKEASVFKSFLARWGEKAPLIARSAFESHQGMWRSAPISVNRFTKGSDPYFAQVIADRL